MQTTLDKAQEIAQLLAEYKTYNKALNNGRASLTLQLLDTTAEQLDRATDRADTQLHSIGDLIK